MALSLTEEGRKYMTKNFLAYRDRNMDPDVEDLPRAPLELFLGIVQTATEASRALKIAWLLDQHNFWCLAAFCFLTGYLWGTQPHEIEGMLAEAIAACGQEGTEGE